MWEDSIVKEVREARESYAAQFNCDLHAIYRDLKEKEKKSGRKTVCFPPRRIKSQDRKAFGE
jgi:hypothetical protein